MWGSGYIGEGGRAGLDGTWARGGASHCRQAPTRTLVCRTSWGAYTVNTQSERVNTQSDLGPSNFYPTAPKLVSTPQTNGDHLSPPTLPHFSILLLSAKSGYGWQCLSVQHSFFFVVSAPHPHPTGAWASSPVGWTYRVQRICARGGAPGGAAHGQILALFAVASAFRATRWRHNLSREKGESPSGKSRPVPGPAQESRGASAVCHSSVSDYTRSF